MTFDRFLRTSILILLNNNIFIDSGNSIGIYEEENRLYKNQITNYPHHFTKIYYRNY